MQKIVSQMLSGFIVLTLSSSWPALTPNPLERLLEINSYAFHLKYFKCLRISPSQIPQCIDAPAPAPPLALLCLPNDFDYVPQCILFPSVQSTGLAASLVDWKIYCNRI